MSVGPDGGIDMSTPLRPEAPSSSWHSHRSAVVCAMLCLNRNDIMNNTRMEIPRCFRSILSYLVASFAVYINSYKASMTLLSHHFRCYVEFPGVHCILKKMHGAGNQCAESAQAGVVGTRFTRNH